MRVNVGVPVECLSDEHLRAEEAEIAMMPGFYNKVWKGKSKIPKRFTLGPGHISFFMNKKTWTLNRYKELHQECLRRGFNIRDKSDRWESWNPKEDIEYKEEGFERGLLIERIEGRIQNSTGYFHYNKKRLPKEDVLRVLRGDY